jgi:hypothetical protein
VGGALTLNPTGGPVKFGGTITANGNIIANAGYIQFRTPQAGYIYNSSGQTDYGASAGIHQFKNGDGTALANVYAANFYVGGTAAVATVSQLANYLPLTGGVLTGQLSFNQGASLAGAIYPQALGWLGHKASAFSWQDAAGNPGLVLQPGGNPSLTLGGAPGTVPTLVLDGANPAIHLKGDANSYYGSIVFSTAYGANTFSISGYGGCSMNVFAGAGYAFQVGGVWKAGIGSDGSYSTKGTITAGGGTHTFGAGPGEAISDTILVVRTTNYYPSLQFQSAFGTGGAMQLCGQFFTAPSGCNYWFDNHYFGAKNQTAYAAITAAGMAFGTTTDAPSASPLKIDMGGSYSTTAGANPKIAIYNNGAGNQMGLGVSASQMDYMVPAAMSHNFYVAGVKAAQITAANLLVGGKKALVMTAAGDNGAVTVSAAAPSGGADGDIWLQYV